MTPHEQIVKGLRDAANAPHSIRLSLDNPQAWPAILTYAETIDADDPDKAAELRHLYARLTAGRRGARCSRPRPLIPI